MSAFAEQVVALLDHLGAERAVVGGTSLGANVALETAVLAPERVAGLVVEMPVLNNALVAGIVSFVPIMLAARYAPFTVNTVRSLTRRVPRGLVPFWAGIALDTVDHRADSIAAVLHGIIYGRLAPSSSQRRRIAAPTLIVGHPIDPIHPFVDADMLLSEMPDARFERASSILEWRFRPERLTIAAVDFAVECWRPRPASGRRNASVGENGGVPLYRDEAVVLRTHKLGEADRIITLLTRRHGRVRAVAKGVRRTTSRWGSRLEPFTHVDLQLAEGRSLDVDHPGGDARPVQRAPGRSTTSATPPARRCSRPPSGWSPRTRSRPSSSSSCSSAACARCRRGSTPAGQVLDSYLLRSLSVAGYAPSFDHCVACGDEGPHRFFNPSAGGVMCTADKLPGSATPAPETVVALSAPAGRRLAGRARDRAAPPARGQHPGRGLPLLAPRARAALDGVRRALSPLAG